MVAASVVLDNDFIDEAYRLREILVGQRPAPPDVGLANIMPSFRNATRNMCNRILDTWDSDKQQRNAEARRFRGFNETKISMVGENGFHDQRPSGLNETVNFLENPSKSTKLGCDTR